MVAEFPAAVLEVLQVPFSLRGVELLVAGVDRAAAVEMLER